MKRRNVLATLGTLSVGGGLVVGSGAFTTVSAERDVAVSIAPDADALLRLVSVPGSGNAEYVEIADGRLVVNVSETNGEVAGDGVNPDAITIFRDLFRIENQGTQTVYVWLLESGGRNGSKQHAFFTETWDDNGVAVSLADFNNGVGSLKSDGRQRQPQFDAGIGTAAVELGVGDSVDIGLVVDTPAGAAGSDVLKDGQAVTIHATANRSELADVFTPTHQP